MKISKLIILKQSDTVVMKATGKSMRKLIILSLELDLNNVQ